jgi:NTP pyrophosphatase (non-canonical NTP hydrolase)
MTMELDRYQELARRTAKPLEQRDDLIHAALGVTSDAGELATQIKAHVIYGKPLDKVNVVEECGDVLWFVCRMLDAVGVSLNDCAAHNIGKLQKRYPDRYTDQAALERADKA